jgi:GNAT superfamily N-acetyltransferase
MQDIVFEEVTEFTAADAATIRQLTTQLSQTAQELSDADYQAIIASPQTHLLVARLKETGQIVGMITLFVFRTPHRMKGMVEDFVVASTLRKHGIGQRLLQFALEQARSLGVVSLMLTSKPEREAANQLYQKLGFIKRDTNVYYVNL